MLKVKLINLPFADVAIPSIALAQLKGICEKKFGEKIQVDIYYLNNDFANYLTLHHYNFISSSGGTNNSGFGDWFFRQEAFPDLKDNTQSYLMRYGALIGMDYLQENGEFLLEKRLGLGAFMENLINTYELVDADVVGFTSMFMQNVACIAMARMIKNLNPNIIMIMGGANCETPMGEELVKNVKFIDYVFSGTALKSFPVFLESIMNGNYTDAESINGVFTYKNSYRKVKDKARVIVKNGGEIETIGPIGDELSINECVPLDYDSFLDAYQRSFPDIHYKPYLLFETSRGCWWGAKAHCTFCGLNGGGMAYRAMKDEYAINMLNELFARYGDRVKHFSCVDNIIPREYIENVFPHLTKPDDITIFYEVKADLSERDMKILSEAGVVEMQPGIESLATSTLKLMKKGTTSFNNIRFLQNAVLYSILPKWNLLIGFPGEEELVYEKYYKDLALFHHLPPPSGVFPVRFDRYSPYYTQAEAYKLDLHPLDYYALTYPFPKDVLNEMAYYFSDHNYTADYIRITGKWLKKLEQRLQDWKDRWANIDQETLPKLYTYQKNEQYFLYDSRSSQTKISALTINEKRILDSLNQKMNKEGLITVLKDIDPNSIIESMNRLIQLGSLFEENGSYMNLALQSEPVLKRVEIFH